MKKNPLIEFGNTPIQTNTLSYCFFSYASPMEKIRSLEKDEQVIRLKKGMYVVTAREPSAQADYHRLAGSLRYLLRKQGLYQDEKK